MAFNLKEYILFRTEIKRELFNEEVDTNFKMVSNPWVATRRYEKGNIVYHPVTIESSTGSPTTGSTGGEDEEYLVWWRANTRTTLGTFDMTQWDIIGGVGGFTNITIAGSANWGRVLANWNFPLATPWNNAVDGLLVSTGPGDEIKFAAGAGIALSWNAADKAMLITNSGSFGEINHGANLGAGEDVYIGQSGGSPNNLQFKGFRATNVGNAALTVGTVADDIVYNFDEAEVTLANISGGCPLLEELCDVNYVGVPGVGDILVWNGGGWINQPAAAGMGNTIYTADDTIIDASRIVSMNGAAGSLKFKSFLSNDGFLIDNNGLNFVMGSNAAVSGAEVFQLRANDTLDYQQSILNASTGNSAILYQNNGVNYIAGHHQAINHSFTITHGTTFNGLAQDGFSVQWDGARNKVWVPDWSYGGGGIQSGIPFAEDTVAHGGRTQTEADLVWLYDATPGTASEAKQLWINQPSAALGSRKAGIALLNVPDNAAGTQDVGLFGYGMSSTAGTWTRTDGVWMGVVDPTLGIQGHSTVSSLELCDTRKNHYGFSSVMDTESDYDGSYGIVNVKTGEATNQVGGAFYRNAGAAGGADIGIYADVISTWAGGCNINDINDYLGGTWAGWFRGCIRVEDGGIALEPLAANPNCGTGQTGDWAAGGQNTLWVNETNNHIYFGDVDLQGPSVTTLCDLADVNCTGLDDGDVLIYDITTNTWNPSVPPSAINIYNADDNLTGNRTLTGLDGVTNYSLDFIQLQTFGVQSIGSQTFITGQNFNVTANNNMVHQVLVGDWDVTVANNIDITATGGKFEISGGSGLNKIYVTGGAGALVTDLINWETFGWYHFNSILLNANTTDGPALLAWDPNATGTVNTEYAQYTMPGTVGAVGQVLKVNALTTGLEWADESAGGGCENSWNLIDVPNGDDIEAVGCDQTLTFVSTDGSVTITGTAGSSTIDFTAKGGIAEVCAAEGLIINAVDNCVEWGNAVGGGVPLAALSTDREIDFGDYYMHFKSASSDGWDFWFDGGHGAAGTGPLLTAENLSSQFHIDNNAAGNRENGMSATALLLTGDALVIEETGRSIPSIQAFHLKFNATDPTHPTYYTDDNAYVQDNCEIIGRTRYDGYLRNTGGTSGYLGESSLGQSISLFGTPGAGSSYAPVSTLGMIRSNTNLWPGYFDLFFGEEIVIVRLMKRAKGRGWADGGIIEDLENNLVDGVWWGINVDNTTTLGSTAALDEWIDGATASVAKAEENKTDELVGLGCDPECDAPPAGPCETACTELATIKSKGDELKTRVAQLREFIDTPEESELEDDGFTWGEYYINGTPYIVPINSGGETPDAYPALNSSSKFAPGWLYDSTFDPIAPGEQPRYSSEIHNNASLLIGCAQPDYLKENDNCIQNTAMLDVVGNYRGSEGEGTRYPFVRFRDLPIWPGEEPVGANIYADDSGYLWLTKGGAAKGGVEEIILLAEGTSIGKPLTISPTTGIVEITPNKFAGGNTPGHVPGFIGKDVTTNFLRADGTWAPPPVGPVGGTGTQDYLARWTPDGSTLGIGIVQDDGTTVGVGAAPVADSRLKIANPDAPNALEISSTASGGERFGLKVLQNSNNTGINYGAEIATYNSGDGGKVVGVDVMTKGGGNSIGAALTVEAVATLPNALGVNSKIEANAEVTITNAVNYESAGAQGEGDATKSYHIYLNPHGIGTSKWGIYQEGADDYNFFQGNTGINIDAEDATVLNVKSILEEESAGIKSVHAVPGTTASSTAAIFAQNNNDNNGGQSYGLQAWADGETSGGDAPGINAGISGTYGVVESPGTLRQGIAVGVHSYAKTNAAVVNSIYALDAAGVEVQATQTVGKAALLHIGILTNNGTVGAAGAWGILQTGDNPNFLKGALTLDRYTLPTVDGQTDQVLKTDGAGTVTWQDQSRDLGALIPKIVTDAAVSAAFGDLLLVASGTIRGVNEDVVITFPDITSSDDDGKKIGVKWKSQANLPNTLLIRSSATGAVNIDGVNRGAAGTGGTPLDMGPSGPGTGTNNYYECIVHNGEWYIIGEIIS